MPFDLKLLDSYPTSPGVYIMKNNRGKILYIGKSKKLKQRIRQYFIPGADGREKIPLLMSQVETIETIVVRSEKEALLLENNLIKEHTPKYNAFFKDDKTYVSLRVTHSTWSKVELIRYRGKPKKDGEYFGPYTSAQAARETLDLLQKLFPLRRCSDSEFSKRTRPCILYDMQKCCAPCVGLATEEEYTEHIKRVGQFLKGQDKTVLKGLYQTMQKESDELEFEKAQRTLRTIRFIEKTLESQNVHKIDRKNKDVIGIYREGEEVVCSQMQYRFGKLLGVKHFYFSSIIEENQKIIKNFILQYYDKGKELPDEILLPFDVDLEEVSLIKELLEELHDHSIKIYSPKKGEKKQIVEMACENSKSAFSKDKNAKEIKEKTLVQMQEKLHLKNYPSRIDCVDPSHLGGKEAVASLVVFVNGEADKNKYRKYKLKETKEFDDYGAMKEVLTRSYTKAKKENNLPDLLVVDGGKGQLNVALKVLEELDIISVDVISLVKEEARHDKGLTGERVYLPNVKDPISLDRYGNVLFLLQQIRDEAHRFAISYQKKRRSQELVKTDLLSLPGIGKVKSTRLLKHFGSLKRLKQASKEEILAVKGISQVDAAIILGDIIV